MSKRQTEDQPRLVTKWFNVPHSFEQNVQVLHVAEAFSALFVGLPADYSVCPLGPGVHAVVAETKVGKSTLVELMAEAVTDSMILRVEEPQKVDSASLLTFIRDHYPPTRVQVPEDNPWPVEGHYGVHRAVGSQWLAVNARTIDVDMVFVDSLRLTQYTSRGTTQKGGLSSGILELLTFLDQQFFALNMPCVVVLNPIHSSDKDELLEFKSRVESSVTSVIYGTKQQNGRHWTVVTRSTDREEVPLSEFWPRLGTKAVQEKSDSPEITVNTKFKLK